MCCLQYTKRRPPAPQKSSLRKRRRCAPTPAARPYPAGQVFAAWRMLRPQLAPTGQGVRAGPPSRAHVSRQAQGTRIQTARLRTCFSPCARSSSPNDSPSRVFLAMREERAPAVFKILVQPANTMHRGMFLYHIARLSPVRETPSTWAHKHLVRKTRRTSEPQVANRQNAVGPSRKPRRTSKPDHANRQNVDALLRTLGKLRKRLRRVSTAPADGRLLWRQQRTPSTAGERPLPHGTGAKTPSPAARYPSMV